MQLLMISVNSKWCEWSDGHLKVNILGVEALG